MQRKYIYIIVVTLTFLLVGVEQYLDSNNSSTAVDSPNYLEEHNDTFNNIESVSSLVITNIQNDDQPIAYTYQISIEGISGAYRYRHNENEGYIVFSANGIAQIMLNSNEFYTIYDLPNNVSYKVEQTNNVSDKYTTTANEKESTLVEGTISLESKATFENRTIIVEEPVKEKPNPITADYIGIPTIIAVIFGLSFIIARKFKVKRFE